MPGFTAISAKTWSALDTQAMSYIQLALLEPDDAGATWPSAMWSQAEVVDSLNDVQRDFLSKTGINCAIQFFIGTANVPRYDLPENVIDILRLAFRAGAQGTNYVELARADTWELDFGTANWENQAAPAHLERRPSLYLTDLVPSLTVQVQPPPGDIGEFEATWTTLATDLTGAGAAFSVPDDWTPYLVWGVLADLLAKEGEANDPDRAAYCAQRYQEGVDLARILCAGVT